jgi:hypothetical protein
MTPGRFSVDSKTEREQRDSWSPPAQRFGISFYRLGGWVYLFLFDLFLLLLFFSLLTAEYARDMDAASPFVLEVRSRCRGRQEDTLLEY